MKHPASWAGRIGLLPLCAALALGSIGAQAQLAPPAPAPVAPAVRYDLTNEIFHPVHTLHGMVASESAWATQAGVDVLRAGGNAVDAAVAVGFALAVSLPNAGNLGGGGFMVVHDARTGKDVAIDFREMAPSAATRNMYLDAAGNVVPNKSLYTHFAVGVPGSVAGLLHALDNYGSKKRGEVMAAAIRLAEEYLAAAPEDQAGWQLLAASRYLAGDRDGALAAWNELGRPTVDLLRIDGSRNVRYREIADAASLAPGTVLTPSRLALSQRRVMNVPALRRGVVEYQPVPGGIAEVRVAIVERRVVDPFWRLLVAGAIGAVAQREVGLEVASPTGGGELWTASWRWASTTQPRCSTRSPTASTPRCRSSSSSRSGFSTPVSSRSCSSTPATKSSPQVSSPADRDRELRIKN